MSLAVLDTTDMVNEAIKIHALSPTAAAALGRALTACTFMCGALKSPQDKLSVTIAGGGPGGKITVCGNGELFIRGSIDEPSADLPLKANGKLDVGGSLGKGELSAKLEVEANAFSKTAEEAIKAAGGNATII